MYESYMVAQLRQYGVTPELLMRLLRGESMLDLMRLYRYGPDKGAATLREAGLLKRPA